MVVTDSSEILPLFEKLMRQHFPSAVFSRMVGLEEFAVELSSGQRIYFEEYSGIETIGWDESEQTTIREYFPNDPCVYSLAYRGIDFVKQALAVLVDSPHYLVDNDCGALLPGNEFVLKLRENPNWYWFDDL